MWDQMSGVANAVPENAAPENQDQKQEDQRSEADYLI